MKAKTSIIWKMPITEFKELVKTASSISEILRQFSFQNKGNNYKTIKNRCEKESISLEHIKLGLNSNKNRKFFVAKTPLKELFVENSSFNRTHLKERIIKENLIEYKCRDCGNEGQWENKKLSLHLEHINGISDDNRKNNLCFLCPNCHSQTTTFAGKKKRAALSFNG
jgi:Zn finger protein HypA/HybF involved in hydrogenase expression